MYRRRVQNHAHASAVCGCIGMRVRKLSHRWGLGTRLVSSHFSKCLCCIWQMVVEKALGCYQTHGCYNPWDRKTVRGSLPGDPQLLDAPDNFQMQMVSVCKVRCVAFTHSLTRTEHCKVHCERALNGKNANVEQQVVLYFRHFVARVNLFYVAE